MELLLPMIRADFAVIENYQYRAGPMLDVPMTVLVGKGDSHAGVESAPHWQKETTQTCQVAHFEGGHFFIHSAREQVLSCLSAVLAEEHACA